MVASTLVTTCGVAVPTKGNADDGAEGLETAELKDVDDVSVLTLLTLPVPELVSVERVVE